jgi:hypothetical protein
MQRRGVCIVGELIDPSPQLIAYDRKNYGGSALLRFFCSGDITAPSLRFIPAAFTGPSFHIVGAAPYPLRRRG